MVDFKELYNQVQIIPGIEYQTHRTEIINNMKKMLQDYCDEIEPKIAEQILYARKFFITDFEITYYVPEVIIEKLKAAGFKLRRHGVRLFVDVFPYIDANEYSQNTISDPEFYQLLKDCNEIQNSKIQTLYSSVAIGANYNVYLGKIKDGIKNVVDQDIKHQKDCDSYQLDNVDYRKLEKELSSALPWEK